MDNPLAELEAWWIDRGQDEEEFGTDVLRYVQEDEAAHIDFATMGGQDTAYPERAEWRLDVAEIEEAAWRWEGGEPEWFETHAVLMPHRSTGALISFAKPLKDPLRAWGAVAKAHREAVGDWLPLERFFRTDLLHSGFGQLASGPAMLLQAYADALRSVGEQVGYTPQVEWSLEDTSLSVVIWGRSYFVARSFDLMRVS